MNNFLFGYWLGGSDNGGNGGNNSNGNGGCILLIVIAVIVVIILKVSDTSIINLIKTPLGILGSLLYPSVWDYYHDVATGSIGLKFFISLGNIIISFLIGVLALLPFSYRNQKDISFIGNAILFLMGLNVMIAIGRSLYYGYNFIF